jgi:hypothetical protein
LLFGHRKPFLMSSPLPPKGAHRQYQWHGGWGLVHRQPSFALLAATDAREAALRRHRVDGGADKSV